MSEQKKTYEDLQVELETVRAEQARLRELLGGLGESDYRMSLPDGHYEYVSPTVERVTGYAPEVWYNNPTLIQRAIHPNYVPYFQEKWAELAEGKVAPTYEYMINDSEGKARWIIQSNHGIYDADGNLIAIEGLLRDVTEQRQAEIEHERLLENIRDSVISTDLEGTILSWNRASEQIYGWTEEEVLGKNIGVLYKEEDMPILVEQVIQPTMEQGYQEGEFRAVRKDGTELIERLVTSLIRDDAGEPVGMVGVVSDITEQKRLEKDLRQNQVLFETFMENSPVIIFAKDKEGHIIMGNSKLGEFFDTPMEQVLGKTVYDFSPKEIADPIWESELKILETGEMLEIEEQFLGPEGTRYLFTSKFPLYNSRGEIYAVGGIITDITERKMAEKEREELQQQVLEAQQQVIQELSTPIIPLMQGIIVMPLVGIIDTKRARDTTRALLAGISEYRAKVVILDITGVPIVDSGVAAHLDKTIQAARLKGARTIITGISDAVAEAIVDLGINWSKLETLRDLQTGLIVALNSMGVKLARNA